MKPAYVILIVLCLLAIFGIGYTIGKNSSKCPPAQDFGDSAAYYRHQRDSISLEVNKILSSITPVTNEAETIEIVVASRQRLQRAVGIDSSASILFSDPK
jgi:hypothetical protein